jgi:hypothetical protein
MTLKIERFRARVRLSGEMRSELRKCGKSAVLDLEEVNLADVEGVRFLNRCEAKGISVVHCSPYIKGWMSRERSPSRKPASGEHCREDDN